MPTLPKSPIVLIQKPSISSINLKKCLCKLIAIFNACNLPSKQFFMKLYWTFNLQAYIRNMITDQFSKVIKKKVLPLFCGCCILFHEIIGGNQATWSKYSFNPTTFQFSTTKLSAGLQKLFFLSISTFFREFAYAGTHLYWGTNWGEGSWMHLNADFFSLQSS